MYLQDLQKKKDMTKKEIEEIREIVRQARIEIELEDNEVWLETKEFLNQFQMFSKDWLEHFGWKLPRERVEIIDDGKTRVTRWAYPRNQIQRMIRTRKFSL